MTESTTWTTSNRAALLRPAAPSASQVCSHLHQLVGAKFLPRQPWAPRSAPLMPLTPGQHLPLFSHSHVSPEQHLPFAWMSRLGTGCRKPPQGVRYLQARF